MIIGRDLSISYLPTKIKIPPIKNENNNETIPTAMCDSALPFKTLVHNIIGAIWTDPIIKYIIPAIAPKPAK